MILLKSRQSWDRIKSDKKFLKTAGLVVRSARNGSKRFVNTLGSLRTDRTDLEFLAYP